MFSWVLQGAQEAGWVGGLSSCFQSGAASLSLGQHHLSVSNPCQFSQSGTLPGVSESLRSCGFLFPLRTKYLSELGFVVLFVEICFVPHFILRSEDLWQVLLVKNSSWLGIKTHLVNSHKTPASQCRALESETPLCSSLLLYYSFLSSDF